jgi:phospholipase/carboxylesterase
VLKMSGAVATAVVPRSSARLWPRPGKPARPAQLGRHNLGLAKGRDGLLSVPASYTPKTPIPLILMLHGRLERAAGLGIFCENAAKLGIAVALPDSRGRTWDLFLGGFGPDIDFLNRVLAFTFDCVAIDVRRVAIAGFSDGASYALSVGLANGDLFTHVIAYSPGTVAPPSLRGAPSLFITHGTQDRILPIDANSRKAVSALKQAGYDVVYEEFNGGHTIKADLVQESFRWFTGSRKR